MIIENQINESKKISDSLDEKEILISQRASNRPCTSIADNENNFAAKLNANNKNAQESFKELNDLKYALDKAAIVFITNKKGIVTYVNDKFCELSLYSKEELIGKTPRILNSGFHSKDFFEDTWNTIKKGNTWRGEVKNKKKNGEFYWLDTVIVPILDETGKPYQYFSIRYDITAKKNKALLIEQTLKEKEVLINEIHHRVKNNLQIIYSLINFKKESIIDKNQDQALNEIQGKIIAMSLAHDEVFKSDSFTQIDFKKYVTRIQSYYIRNQSTIVHFNTKGESVFINLDLAINCGIILSEIISNCIKYAFTPSINIFFSEKKSVFLIKIFDNGIGFPDDIIKKKRRGMGLELIEGLATQMNGKMELYNEKGAVYEITINI